MCGECRVMCDQEERRYWILHVPFRGFPLRSSLPPPHTLFPHTLPPHTLLSHSPPHTLLSHSPPHPPLTHSQLAGRTTSLLRIISSTLWQRRTHSFCGPHDSRLEPSPRKVRSTEGGREGELVGGGEERGEGRELRGGGEGGEGRELRGGGEGGEGRELRGGGEGGEGRELRGGGKGERGGSCEEGGKGERGERRKRTGERKGEKGDKGRAGIDILLFLVVNILSLLDRS